MEKEIKSLQKEAYISPDIDVLNVEIVQNVLADGSGNGGPMDMGGEDW